MANEPNAIISQRIEVAPGLVKFRVIPDGWELPDFTPGQFTVLGLPGSAPRVSVADPEESPADPDKLIRRAYSIASSSKAKQYLEFYIALVYSGALTPRLLHLNVGDKLWASPKFAGLFTLAEVPPDQNAILIATGTGVAPYMSMIRTEVSDGLRHRFAVVHAARHSWDLGYNNELQTLDKMSDVLDYFPIISEPEKEKNDWKGLTGFVDKIWKNDLIDQVWGIKPNPENTHIFLCGNPLMIDMMVEILNKEGYTKHSKKNPGQLHLEKF